MGVDHPELAITWQRINREIKRVAKATLQNASIGRAGIRIYDGGRLRIEGGGGIDIVGTGYINIDGDVTGSGDFDWTGPWELAGDGLISGDVDGTGVLDWSGTVYLKGPTGVQGNFAVSGQSNFTGDVTLNSDLTLGSGRILAGPLIIDKAGGYGARVYSTGTLLLDASGNVVLGANTQVLGTLHALGDLSTTSDLSVLGSSTVLGAKSFRMPHPLKDEHWLQHGCTESPISGTEYTGRITIGEDGSAVVELPDYFEALNKARNRTVQVTPIGRPFMVGAEDVVDGRTVVYGEPGREVFWLVKAERTGGDFETEAPIPPAPFVYD